MVQTVKDNRDPKFSELNTAVYMLTEFKDLLCVLRGYISYNILYI